MAKPGIVVTTSVRSVDDTPEAFYWAEKIRAELDDHGRRCPDEGPLPAVRRALDRAMLLGPGLG